MHSDLYTATAEAVEWGKTYLEGLALQHDELSKSITSLDVYTEKYGVPPKEMSQDGADFRKIIDGYEKTAAEAQKNLSKLYSLVEEITENRKRMLEILDMELIDGTPLDAALMEIEQLHESVEPLCIEYEQLQEHMAQQVEVYEQSVKVDIQ